MSVACAGEIENSWQRKLHSPNYDFKVKMNTMIDDYEFNHNYRNKSVFHVLNFFTEKGTRPVR